MAEFETSSIYVDLDCLFDTRLATLATFSIEAVENAVANGYYSRLYDDFDGVDKAAFDEAYKKRSTQTLKNSLVTAVPEILKNFAKQTLVALVSTPFRRQPVAVVNTYPYRLSEEEVNLIIAGLSAATDKLLDIKVVHLAPEELTPSFIKANFVQVVMYSYWEWLDIHAENGNLTQVQCPNITLIGPAIVKDKDAAKALTGQDVFSALESYVGLFIKLTLFPINVYCVDLQRLKDRQTAD